MIEWAEDWRGRVVPLDWQQRDYSQPFWLEIAKYEFIPVLRHRCEPEPKPVRPNTRP